MTELSNVLTTWTPGLLVMNTSTMVAVFLPILAAVLLTIILPVIRRQRDTGEKNDV